MPELVPRPYQELIRDAIIDNKRIAIWSFMGSGKTTATLLALDVLSVIEGSIPLIIAPELVARTVWPGEVEKWTNLNHIRLSTIVGTPAQRVRAIQTPADAYTVNFENLPWLINYFKDKWPFKTVIVDESSKLKGFRGSFQKHPKSGKWYVRRGGTTRSSALAKLAFTKIDRFVELTGTPSSKGMESIWGQMWFLDQGMALGRTFSRYMERYFKKSYNGFSYEILKGADEEIRDKIKHLCFALVAEDWFDVKKPVITNIMVELGDNARGLYRSMEDEFFIQIQKHEVEAANAAVKSGKLSQIANGAIYTDGTNFEEIHGMKIEALRSLVEESEGAPLLVVYNYKHDLTRLQKAFPKGVKLDGKLSTVKKWNAGKIPMMFVHAASAGHGNSFQDGGNIIVYFGLDWDLELYEQVLERIGPVRQLQSGYNRLVYVYHILAKDTIDEVKLKRLQTKASVQQLLLEAAARREL